MKYIYILQHKENLMILGCCATRELAEKMLEGGVNVQIVECEIMHS